MSYTAAICTRGLSKDYGAGHGLFDLELEVERGEIFGRLPAVVGAPGRVTRLPRACHLSPSSRDPPRG